MPCCDHFRLPAVNSLAAATPNNKTAHLGAPRWDVKNELDDNDELEDNKLGIDDLLLKDRVAEPALPGGLLRRLVLLARQIVAQAE